MLHDSIERISLCKVSGTIDGQRMLLRLADINDGVLSNIFILDEAPKMFDNRTRLFWRNGPVTDGAFGVWEWSAIPNRNNPDTDYVETTYSESKQTIELIEVSGASTIDDLIKNICDGIPAHPVGQKTMFCTQRGVRAATSCEGVLCSGADIVIENGKTAFSDTAVSLPVFSFSRQDVLVLEGKLFYRKLDVGAPARMILVKEPSDIVREAIVRRTSWSAVKPLGITKNTWKSIRDLITEMPTETLFQEIALSCGCGEAEAKEYIEKFLTQVDRYIDQEDYDSKVMKAILERQPEFKKKCEDIVSEYWYGEHRAEVDKAQTEVAAVSLEIQKKKDELENKEKQLSAATEQLSKIIKNVQEQEQLALGITEKVQSRISEARADAAGFIAEMAFVSPSATVATTVSAAERNINQTVCFGTPLEPEQIESSSEWKDAVETLRYELSEAGVSEKYALGFAAFLYSASINHMPILLAGPNGNSIADAFSAALYGRTAGVIDCSGPYSANIEDDITASDVEVFIIKNALRNEWITHIPEFRLSSKFFFIEHPFMEDLLIEPKSLFSYALPIFTELIVNAAPTMQYVGARKTDDFIEYQSEKAKPLYDKLLKSIGCNMYTRSQLQMVITDFHALHQSESADFDCLFAIFPFAYLAGRHQAPLLDKLFESISISGELKKELEIFTGAGNE